MLTLSVFGCVKLNKAPVALENNTSGHGNSAEAGDGPAWPDSSAGAVPQLAGSVISVIDKGEKGGIIYLAATGKEEASAYVQKLKDIGYEGNEIIYGNGFISFSGSKDKDGRTVTFYYHPEGGKEAGQSSCMVMYEKKTEESLTASGGLPERAICKYLPKT